MSNIADALFDPSWDTERVIIEHASLAIDAVYNGLSVELDLSSDTLSILDHYVSNAGIIDDAILQLLSATTGAYFGEILRRSIGGNWHIHDKDDPFSWELRFTSCPLSLFPALIALEVISKGSMGTEHATMIVAPSREALLLELLERSPKLTEEEYFSFSGRIDAIQLSVSFLSDVEKKVADRKGEEPTRFGEEDPRKIRCIPLSVMDEPQ